MTKFERMEARKLTEFARVNAGAAKDSIEVGYLARAWASLIRSTHTVQSRWELTTAASAWPCVVQHKDFIV